MPLFRDVDMVLIRENTEDLYAGLEHTVVPGVVESLKIITEKSLHAHRSLRLRIRAQARPQEDSRHPQSQHHETLRRPLSLVHSRGRRTSIRDIEYKELIIDNACMQMVLNPRQFDMLLLTNLYGDIMSDLAAGLVGGLGVVPSANIGETTAIFEAVHGTAPDIAGKGIANPTALLMSAIMMLDHIGESTAAREIESALHEVYREGRTLTRDVGGTATTAEFTDAVINKLGVAVRS